MSSATLSPVQETVVISTYGLGDNRILHFLSDQAIVDSTSLALNGYARNPDAPADAASMTSCLVASTP